MIKIDEDKYELHFGTSKNGGIATITDKKCSTVFECGDPIDIFQFFKEGKSYFVALSRYFKVANPLPDIILSNSLTKSHIQVPTFSECLIDEIKLRDVPYTIDAMSCVEVSVPVKFSNIEDCLTYIFFKGDDSPKIFPFVGVFSSYLDTFIEPSELTNFVHHTNKTDCVSSEDLKKLIEREYLPKIKLLEQALEASKQDEKK